MNDTAIRADSLTRDFETLRAVDGLTMEIPRGSVFGFLGPNGSGKTTTIRLLLGLLEPTAGRAEVLGFDTRSQADQIRERAGALLEHTGLYERLSAEDNLDYFGRIWHLPADRRRARIQELLTHLDLWERRKEAVGRWSRGMKQKLAVARAMLHRPDVIFLDEPTASLDPIAAAALREDIAALTQREGVTVFLTTHNLTEAERLCSRVAVINRGRLLAIGGPDELRARTGGSRLEILGRGFTPPLLAQLKALPEVHGVEQENGRLILTLAEDADSAPLVNLLVNAGAQVQEVRRGKASLEEVFLTLMQEEREREVGSREG
jgi:ABC-2 type transport system ATP-binding protein